ncbi:vWA domain-containing protein [Paraliomyxa miuraensis]|uniref:vWA domain-containing protein n=1 Tax=Paraliomyxa miuraensis TaxID=376150 RepID=UPI00225A2BE8|nr:VWA domain-containing protein [Paraliomyxa miuraensis]MCX4243111.1 VWA domain-containing protein [Paraliomyxa miuraensis]
MSLAQPWALALALLALPVVVAYFHRRRRTPLRVPSAMLLRVIAGQATPKSRAMAKPRHLLSLLLVLLALTGLVAAMVDLQRDEEHPRNYIVVLDTSASMGATSPGDEQSRLQDAIERLRSAMDRLGQQDRVALITADDKAVVRVGLTEDHARVLEVARDQRPQGTSEGTPAALRIADALCRANDYAQVVLLSDGVGVSVPQGRCAIEHVPVGRIGANVGINALSVREADALGLAEVYLAVGADREQPSEVEVELWLDDQLMEVVPFDLPAEGEVKRLLRVPMPPGRRVTAQLRASEDDEDLLAADDMAWAPRRIGGRVRTLLVTSTRLSFTAEALRLHPRVDLTVIGPTDQTPTESFDLIVLEAGRPAPALPQASHVAVFIGHAESSPSAPGATRAPGADLGFSVREAGVEDAEIVRWSFDDPLFRFVSFDEVQVPKANVLEVGEGQTSIIDSDRGPLAVVAHEDGRELLAFGFVPHESDFVLRVGFVNLVANLVEWAAPPLPQAEGEEAESFAMPAIESRVDPPIQIPGTTRGEWSGPVRTHLAVWRLLAWLAAAVLALEWLLPGLALGIGRLWLRLAPQRARRGRRAPRKRPLGRSRSDDPADGRSNGRADGRAEGSKSE